MDAKTIVNETAARLVLTAADGQELILAPLQKRRVEDATNFDLNSRDVRKARHGQFDNPPRDGDTRLGRLNSHRRFNISRRSS